MARPKPPPVLESPRELLRGAGLRCTASRLAVLQHLRQERRPLSHGELIEALADRGFDAATLYRNLIDLEGVELAQRVNLGDNVWRFESRASDPRDARHTHPHFVCLQCGEILCLAEVQVKLSPAPGTIRSVVSSVSDIVLKGQCAQCA